ncbi:hypothetical protein [Streptomyces paradoxus]|uniref:hypothetical protein n=1 Tax=Streptomyces paradoxus TaxID=66375 RepID=UPI00380C35FB
MDHLPEVDSLIRLRTELPDLRTALDHCASSNDLAVAGVEIAVSLARTRCWFSSSTLKEDRHWLERRRGSWARLTVCGRTRGWR